MEAKYKAYIVIATYNAMPWLDKCLASIDFIRYKTIVVDNNSKDETVDYIKKNYPEIKLFEEKLNLGFGKANNKGISYALNNGAEYVYLLNQDAYLINDPLDKLISIQKENREYGILSPIHLNAEMSTLDLNFSRYVGINKNRDFYPDHVIGKCIKDIYDVSFVNAAGWLISRECLMDVGGFDPIFFHYGEDENYCQRALYHGYKIGIVPDSFMIHDRCFRAEPTLESSPLEFFKMQERRLIIRHTDVSKECNKICDAVVHYSKLIFKYILKLKIKYIIVTLKEIKLYFFIRNKLIDSIQKNRLKRPNHLVINKKE